MFIIFQSVGFNKLSGVKIKYNSFLTIRLLIVISYKYILNSNLLYLQLI